MIYLLPNPMLTFRYFLVYFLRPSMIMATVSFKVSPLLPWCCDWHHCPSSLCLSRCLHFPLICSLAYKGLALLISLFSLSRVSTAYVNDNFQTYISSPFLSPRLWVWSPNLLLPMSTWQTSSKEHRLHMSHPELTVSTLFLLQGESGSSQSQS